VQAACIFAVAEDSDAPTSRYMTPNANQRHRTVPALCARVEKQFRVHQSSKPDSMMHGNATFKQDYSSVVVPFENRLGFMPIHPKDRQSESKTRAHEWRRPIGHAVPSKMHDPSYSQTEEQHEESYK
jgi:hypothetical protein